MAKAKLIGVQDMDFNTRKGDHIDGIKLHITYPDENVMGLMADGKFISREACKLYGITVDGLAPMIGKDVEFETNVKGKVTGVRPFGKSN